MNPNLIALIIILVWGVWAAVDKNLVMNIHPIYAEMYLAIAGFLIVPVCFFWGKGLDWNLNLTNRLLYGLAYQLSLQQQEDCYSYIFY